MNKLSTGSLPQNELVDFFHPQTGRSPNVSSAPSPDYPHVRSRITNLCTTAICPTDRCARLSDVDIPTTRFVHKFVACQRACGHPLRRPRPTAAAIAWLDPQLVKATRPDLALIARYRCTTT
jgi:hypothetical protein